MLWFRLLLADMSPRRYEFDRRTVRLGFVVDNVVLRKDILLAPVFFLCRSQYRRYINISTDSRAT
jgi:hypothetical protein